VKTSKPSIKSRAAVALAGLCLIATLSPAHAGDVPSCYAANNLDTPPADRAIFVFIDQTTLLNAELRRSVMSNTGNFIKPGTTFTIGSFSAYAQGRYLEVTKTGTLETALPDSARNSTKLRILETFDACLAGQWNYGLKVAAGALTSAMNGASAMLSKSDVEASIRAVSDVVRASPAKDRVVLIVSDMLENSSVSSFYSEKTVRHISPAKELALAQVNGMTGNFGGAKVFVLGAGLLSEDKKGAYRDPKTMDALKSFWTGYFKASNANLAEFGQPALLNPVR
jgi:hypothetical protein